MQAQNWLSLTDYASKYRISVSTLRRRIKAHQITFSFEEGKYLLLDDGNEFAETQSTVHSIPDYAGAYVGLPIRKTPPIEPTREIEKTEAGLEFLRSTLQQTQQAQQAQQIQTGATSAQASISREEPILSSASKLLNELKRAYMNILHEKEEQMIQLKEEVSDLKTLVRVLEDDNDRMRRAFGQRPIANL